MKEILLSLFSGAWSFVVVTLVVTFAADAGTDLDRCRDYAINQGWWENGLGSQKIVLPGFQPLRVDNSSVILGAGRKYVWNSSLFPTEIRARGLPLAGSIRLLLTVDGETPNLTAVQQPSVEWFDGHHVVVRTRRSVTDSLSVEVETRIEYDGLAMSKVRFTSTKSVSLDNIAIEMRVVSNANTRMIRFDRKTIRRRAKEVVSAPAYNGNFLDVVAFADGNRSFWWFADGDRFPGIAPSTLVHEADGAIRLRQQLTSRPILLDGTLSYSFNFMATPIRDLSGDWRRDRIARRIDKDEARHARIHAWWVSAFAHHALPFTRLPAGVSARLPRTDLLAYKGVQESRKELASARRLGIDRLPYLSLHALSVLDPAAERCGSIWQVDPPYVIPAGADPPFTSKFERPWSTHNADGFSDYMLARLNAVIDEAGFEGVYFDQGGIIQSKPVDGVAAWEGTGDATDILAVRSFLKRLATLFHIKGKRGLVYVHNSGSSVVPAYGFAAAMVQGEEYIHLLKNLDYIASMPLDVIRTKFSPDQYGVVTVLLSELWSARVKGVPPRRMISKEQWLGSVPYQRAFRTLMANALLHDVPVWSFAPIAERNALYGVMDDFGVDDSVFVGYWNLEGREALAANVLISYYVHRRFDRLLIIVSNLGTTDVTLSLPRVEQWFAHASGCPVTHTTAIDGVSTLTTGNTELGILAKDFVLVEASVSGRCR